MSKTGYVYLMKNNRNGYIKIGFTTKEPEFREKTLASEDHDISLIHKQYGLTMKEEKEIHELYDYKRLRGEWFDLSEDEIDSIITKLHRMFIKENKTSIPNKSTVKLRCYGEYETMIVKEILYSLYQESSDITTIGDKCVIAFDINHPFVEKVLRIYNDGLDVHDRVNRGYYKEF